jgi:hypothetical protein
LGGAPARGTGQTEYPRRRRSSVHNVRTHEAKTREEWLNRVHPAAQRHESRRPDIRKPRRDGTGCALREALRNLAQQTRVHSAARFATDATPPGCALRDTREIQWRENRGEATPVPWRDSQRLKTEPSRKEPTENRRRKSLENRRRGSPGGANLCAAHAVTAASSPRERDSHGAPSVERCRNRELRWHANQGKASGERCRRKMEAVSVPR